MPFPSFLTPDYGSCAIALTYPLHQPAFLGVRHAALKMKALGRPGSIVTTCSTAGIRARPGLCTYSMSKFAVRALTVTAAQELTRDGIRVNAVCPGITDTPLLEQFRELDEIAKGTLIGLYSPFFHCSFGSFSVPCVWLDSC